MSILKRVADWLRSAPLESGVCCCGSAVKDHGLGDGHSPVDDLGYSASQLLQEVEQAMIAGDTRTRDLLEANNRYVEINRNLKAQLRKDREAFAFYADQHRAKKTEEADEKAKVNDQFVTDITTCLKTNSPS